MAIKSHLLPVPAGCMESLLQEVTSGKFAPSSYGASLLKTSDTQVKLTAMSAEELEYFKRDVMVSSY